MTPGGALTRAFIALAAAIFSMLWLAAIGESQDRPRRLIESLSMRSPDGAGPFPAMMLVPVCSGMSKKENASHYREMAERLTAMGYLVAHVDYVAARRLADACGSFVTPDEIARDIAAVATHLGTLPLVKPSRIDVIGESLGGAGVLEALSRPGPDGLPPFRKAAVFYPVCRGVAAPRARAAVLMLFGAVDGMTPAESCDQLIRQFPRPSDVVVRVYPGARHAFNFTHLPESPPAGKPTWTAAYNPAAAKAAWDDTVDFLRR